MFIKIPSLKLIASQSVSTFKRFPLAVISALLTMSIFIYLIQMQNPEYKNIEILIKIAFASSLGVFMFTALRLLGDKNPLSFVGIALIVGYYLTLPDMENPSSTIFMRHFFLILMFFIMTLWASYWKSNPTNGEFWEWTQRVIFGFLTSIIFGIVLYGGLSLALFSIDKLFSLDIESKRYAQLLILVIGLFGVNYFLSQIPKNPHNLTIHTYTKIETIFAKFIITPLVIFYFLILYSYTFKILITLNWPEGILAWIIIIFSFVAIITYLFWTPLWSERAKKYKRFLFLALLLQTIMLAISINIRVSDYGWTENRYMISILGIWLFGISLYFLVLKDAKYKWIFISLTLLVFISQVGPFSSYAISKSSQQDRLKTLLENSKPLSKKLDIQTRYEISDMINYLSKKHGLESLEPIIPKIVAKYKKENGTKNQYGFSNFATKKLGFDYVNKWDLKKDETSISIYRPQNRHLNISGYDWIIESSYNINYKKPITKIIENSTIFYLTDKNLEVKENNITIANISLEDFYENLLTNAKSFDFNHKDKNVSLKIILFNMFADKNGSIKNINARILYKRF